jgi:hypothetical protein
LLPPSQHDPGEVRDEIERILSQREYREPPRPIFQRIMDWISERIAELIGDILGGGRVVVIGWIISAIVAVVVTYLLVRFVLALRADPSRREADMADPRRPPEDWAADAQRHEANGEWRQALRCRYRALVAHLAARGLVDEIPGRTAGEYRAEVAANLPPAAQPFSAATFMFEEAWYGGADVDEIRHAQFRAAASEVTATVRV